MKSTASVAVSIRCRDRLMASCTGWSVSGPPVAEI